MIDNSYFSISEKKAINHIAVFSPINVILGASDIIYSDVIDSFISEILKYKSLVIQSLTENP